MLSSLKTIGLAVVALAAVPSAGAAQQPRVTNGRIAPQPAGSPFVQSFRAIVSAQTDVAWVGYGVPVADGDRVMCCFGSGTTWVDGNVISSRSSNCCGGCRLEPSAEGTTTFPRSAPSGGPVKLEGSDRMVVLFRVADRRVERIRVFSDDCELDAGGRSLQWIENVNPADSVSLLETYAASDTDSRDRVTSGAIMAIALHGRPAADRAFDTLSRFARTAASTRTRGDALFWLAQQGDQRAPAVIREALDKDASPDVRKKAVFALSQLKDDRGVQTLIEVARNHSDPGTRGEAIFWLGQKAGSRASAAITERIEQDPDTEVKKKAVFALSQLPKDEGVPLLIKVARTNTNPAVRKQAMFWLGQSRDPRAIDFFAEILK